MHLLTGRRLADDPGVMRVPAEKVSFSFCFQRWLAASLGFMRAGMHEHACTATYHATLNAYCLFAFTCSKRVRVKEFSSTAPAEHNERSVTTTCIYNLGLNRNRRTSSVLVKLEHLSSIQHPRAAKVLTRVNLGS